MPSFCEFPHQLVLQLRRSPYKKVREDLTHHTPGFVNARRLGVAIIMCRLDP